MTPARVDPTAAIVEQFESEWSHEDRFRILIAENDAVLEQGDHGDCCPCSDCVDERHADEDERRAADLEYDRITGGRGW